MCLMMTDLMPSTRHVSKTPPTRSTSVVMADVIGAVASVLALSQFALMTLRTIRRVHNASQEIEDFQVRPNSMSGRGVRTMMYAYQPIEPASAFSSSASSLEAGDRKLS